MFDSKPILIWSIGISKERKTKGTIMKKRMCGVLLIAVSCLFLVSLFLGCSDIPRSKALIVVNASENTITSVSIGQTNSIPKADLPNALLETIAPGESMTFYLGASLVDWVYLNISDDSGSDAHIYFAYEYSINGDNKDITASYTGTEITLGEGTTVISPVA
jgi:hypothetical protein